MFLSEVKVTALRHNGERHDFLALWTNSLLAFCKCVKYSQVTLSTISSLYNRFFFFNCLTNLFLAG